MGTRAWIVVLSWSCWLSEPSLAIPNPSNQTPVASKKTEHVKSDREALLYLVQSAFELLLINHPSREIREDLVELIKRSEVAINFTDRPTPLAEELAIVAYVRQDGKRLLALHVNAAVLMDPNVPTVTKQLVLFHHWIHLKQQRARTYPVWLADDAAPVRFGKAEMRAVFQSELDALTAECDLAIRISRADALGLCLIYQRRELPMMREIVAACIAEKPEYAPQRQLIFEIAHEKP